jgi:hypothetical protein
VAGISWTRRSYEATVVVIPLDPDARAWLDARSRDDLAGIVVAGEDLLDEQSRFRSEPVPATGEGRAVSSPLDHAVHDADVVVLFTHDLAAVAHDVVAQTGDAARASGTLLGAVVVSTGARWEHPAELATAAVVREAADNVVILRDDRFVLAFLQVLRGGARDGAAPADLLGTAT